jgi:4-diphosphocytidyl-2-C-methyl-D-erythritol kinase
VKKTQIQAYAKINPAIDILGKLPNGYHQVRMIMQTIDLWDTITIEKTPSAITLRTDAATIPEHENLAYKAAQIIRDEYHIKDGVSITLHKKIPIAAGMGGGSSDAAAVLHGINELFTLGASETTLETLGLRLGADVPFCLRGGTALAEGIGEKLTTLPKAPQCHILIAKPSFAVSTAQVYASYKDEAVTIHPDIDALIQAITTSNQPEFIAGMENVLESVTIPLHPELRWIKAKMIEFGAAKSLMSGSGPTIVGIFHNRDAAMDAQEKLSQTWNDQAQRDGFTRPEYIGVHCFA